MLLAKYLMHAWIILIANGTPTIGKDEPENVLIWIHEKISCFIPDEQTNPDLHHLVTKYQMHKCSEYCKWTKIIKYSSPNASLHFHVR